MTGPWPVSEPAYFQHYFEIRECAGNRGVPHSMVTFCRGIGMDVVLENALEALSMLLETAADDHPDMRMSLDPSDWDLQLVDVVSPMELPGGITLDDPIKNCLVWNLGLRKGSIWQETPEAVTA